MTSLQCQTFLKHTKVYHYTVSFLAILLFLLCRPGRFDAVEEAVVGKRVSTSKAYRARSPYVIFGNLLRYRTFTQCNPHS
jgi:hypothetical protein